MQNGLRFANRLRLDLAVEIHQLASGVRSVTQVTANGRIDATEQTLTALQQRFALVEDLISALSPS